MTELVNEGEIKKTPSDHLRDILAQIKEMQHYSISNIEKLTGFYLKLEDELKQKEIALQIENLLEHQNHFNDAVGEVINSYEMTLNRMQEKTSE